MKILTKTALSFAIASLIACGGAEEKSNTTKNETAESTEETVVPEETNEAEETPIEKELVEITLAATGETMTEIAYEPKALSIPENSRVILTLENKSSMAGMLHNFVLVELGTGQEIATAGISAGKDKDFVPEDNRVIAYTKVADIGETVTVEFDAPAKGSYHYICTFPGHYPNMIGRLNVE